MATRIMTLQSAFESATVARTTFRFAPGEYDALRDKVEADSHPCEWCDKRYTPKVAHGYFDPWSPLDQTEPDYTDWYCSAEGTADSHYGESCYDRYAHDGDFSPEYCDRCNREVIQRNPSNGWRRYFVEDPEGYGMCCVACAQRFYLEYGHTREQMERGVSVHCDFYDTSDLEARGFVEGASFFRERQDSDELEHYHAYCLDLIGRGFVVLTDQGRTAIGLGPDEATVWYRPMMDVQS